MRALACVLSCLGCAHPADLRAEGWVEVRTVNIRLRTDVSEDRAVEMATSLQRSRDALAGVAFRCRSAARDEINVTALEDLSDFRRLRDDAIAFATPPDAGLLYLDGELVFPAVIGRATEQIFLHEVTHLMVAACIPQAPLWLHEGLAGFFETATIGYGHVLVGLPAYVPAGVFETATYEGVIVQRVPRDRFMTIPALRAVDDLSGLREAERSGYYASSWALVHSLYTDRGELKTRFIRYLESLGRGRRTEPEAWQAELATEAVRARYAATLRADAFDYFRWTYDLPPNDRATVRRLDPLEGHMHWVSLLRRHPAAAQAHVERAEIQSPSNLDVALARAEMCARVDDRRCAAEAVRSASRLAPDNARAARAAIELALDSRFAAPSGGARAELERNAALLRASARRFYEHDSLARAELVLGNLDSAIASARRAVADRGTCWRCRATLGSALAATGDLAGAERELRRAIAYVPHDGDEVRASLGRALAELRARSAETCAPPCAGP